VCDCHVGGGGCVSFVVSRSSKLNSNGFKFFGPEIFDFKSFLIENVWAPGFVRKEEEVYLSR